LLLLCLLSIGVIHCGERGILGNRMDLGQAVPTPTLSRGASAN
jgi:hypothetical protein